MTITMTRADVIQQLSFWKELWESKKAECDKYENREYAWEKKYMLNCNIEVCKIALEALKQPERKKGKWEWDAEEGYWCSECKEYVYGCTEEIMEGSYKFCPFCGSENEENQWTEGKE